MRALLRLAKEIFKQLRASFQVNRATQQHVGMLLSKGLFPDEQPHAWDRMNETALPTRDAVQLHLEKEPCNEADNARAFDLWRVFKCTRMHK